MTGSPWESTLPLSTVDDLQIQMNQSQHMRTTTTKLLPCSFRNIDANKSNHLERMIGQWNRHPGPLTRWDTLGRRKRVAILGAGMAGLSAAFELAKFGHQITVFEAADRVGGRVRTHYFPDATHAELGAMRIPSNHYLTLHYIRELGLAEQLVRFCNYNPNGFLMLGNVRQRLRHCQFNGRSSYLSLFPTVHPRIALSVLMDRAVADLCEEELQSYFADTFIGKLAEYGNMSLHEYLAAQMTSTQEILALCQANGIDAYRHASFAEVLLDYHALSHSEQFCLHGGMTLLARAFADTPMLANRIFCNCPVQRVSAANDGVEVTFEPQANLQRTAFDYVICAVPAPAICRIEFDPPLPPEQCHAYHSVHYANATKTVVHCSQPFFWLEDGIKGGSSFTDTRIQQVWYPNHQVREDHPCALTASYAWEESANEMSGMPDEQRFGSVRAGLEPLHPKCGRFFGDYIHSQWADEIGRGAFAYFSPGQHNAYLALMRHPFPMQRPRIWFAGEHLAVGHAWIQGALETGLQAAIAVLQAPSPALSKTDSLCSGR